MRSLRVGSMHNLTAYCDSEESDEEDATASYGIHSPRNEKRTISPLPGGLLGVASLSPAEPESSFWDDDDRKRLRIIEESTPASSVAERATTATVCRKRKLDIAGPSWSTECERETSRAQALTDRGVPNEAPPTTSLIPPDKPLLYYVHHRVAPFFSQKRVAHGFPTRIKYSVTAHDGAVNKFKWCSRDEYSHLAVTASMDTTVKVWNMFSKSSECRCLSTFTCHRKAVKDVNWSSNGDKLLTCGYDRCAILTDVQTGSVLYRHHLGDFLLCNAFQPPGSDVALLGGDSKLYLVDYRISSSSSAAMQYSYKDKFGQVQDVTFDRGGEMFFSSGSTVSRESANMSIMAWDVRTGAVLSNQMYQEHYACVRLKLHPMEPVLFAQTSGNYIALFSQRSPFKMNRRKRYESHSVDGYPIGFDISPDGTFVVSGSSDGDLYGYDSQSSKRVAIWRNGWTENACLDVSVHPVLPTTLAACSWGGQVNLWT